MGIVRYRGVVTNVYTRDAILWYDRDMTAQDETPLEQRRTADGRRRITLTRRERDDLVRQELIESAVFLYLDIHTHRTTQAIADELGITRKQLKTLTMHEDFITIYNDYFMELGHDPRLLRYREAISDLLPDAFDQIEKLITGAGTKDSTKLKACLKVFEYCGMKPVELKGSDRRELAEFLGEAGATLHLTQVNVEAGATVNVGNPPEHEEALELALAGEIRDVENETGVNPENPGEVENRT